MYNKIKRAIEKIGNIVTLTTGNKKTQFRAVIYPIQQDRKLYGGIQNNYEGMTEPDRYAMFSDSDCMKDTERNDIVRCGSDIYRVLWKDEFSFKSDSYIKTYLKKITDEE